jgi:hypothetical protein
VDQNKACVLSCYTANGTALYTFYQLAQQLKNFRAIASNDAVFDPK